MANAKELDRAEKTRVVERYFECVLSRRAAELPITADYGSESPQSGRITGSAAVEYLMTIGAEMTAIRIAQHVVEGNFVATIIDEDTPHGTLPVFALFELAGDRVRFVRVFFDSAAAGA